MACFKRCLPMVLCVMAFAESWTEPMFMKQAQEDKAELEHAATCAQLGVPTSAMPRRGNKQDELAFGMEMRAKTTSGEQKVLLTLLKDSEDWDPEAPGLLREVLSRERIPRESLPNARQLQGAHCFMQDSQTECESNTDDMCVPCRWDGSSCTQRSCFDYTSETECCANNNKIANGCLWRTETWDPVGSCSDYSCSSLSSSECAQDVNCIEHHTGGCTWKTDPYVTSMDMSYDADCPPMECTACLKAEGSCSGMRIAALSGRCKSNCKDAVHCESEVDCLMKRTKNTDPCKTYACNAAKTAPSWVHPSCAAAGSTPTTTTTTDATDFTICEDGCKEMDKDCGACGDETCKEYIEEAESARMMLIIVIVVLVVAACCGIAACIACCICCSKKNRQQQQPAPGNFSQPVIVGQVVGQSC